MTIRDTVKRRIAASAAEQAHAQAPHALKQLLHGLYRAHWHELCRYVTAKFGPGPPEPEDVAQMAFVRFAVLEDPYAVEHPRAFLLKIAHNIVIDYGRKVRMQRQYCRASSLDAKNTDNNLDDLSPERVFLAQEEIEAVRKALMAMPEMRRRLFLLQRVEGKSYVELSRMTGLSQTTVKYHVAMALADCTAAAAGEKSQEDGV